MTGASIRIFLPDGNPEAVRVVSKSHWTGVAIAAARSRYAEVRAKRDEIKRPGVYVLIGPANDASKKERVYVGESENPQLRLDEHHSKKDFWTRFVVFSSQTPQTLNKATIRHVESRLLQLAATSDRVEIDNIDAPGVPPLPEAEAADAEAFLGDMLVIYPLLGVTAFEPADEAAATAWLALTGPDAQGTGAENDEGFLVRAGATARAQAVESIPSWAASLRQTLLQSGVLEPVANTNSLRLTRDHQFASPSAAAATLLGRSAAGPVEWKTNDGTTLRALRAKAVAGGISAS